MLNGLRKPKSLQLGPDLRDIVPKDDNIVGFALEIPDVVPEQRFSFKAKALKERDSRLLIDRHLDRELFQPLAQRERKRGKGFSLRISFPFAETKASTLSIPICCEAAVRVRARPFQSIQTSLQCGPTCGPVPGKVRRECPLVSRGVPHDLRAGQFSELPQQHRSPTDWTFLKNAAPRAT